MNVYQVLTLIMSFLSIIISLFAVGVAYLPYSKRIVFRVSLNPFTHSKDGIEICFSIINKTNKDLLIKSLTAIKIISVQIFDEKDYPHLVKANDSEIFRINTSKLKFDSIPALSQEMTDEKEKNLKYIKFSILNSIRESITYKMRVKDYINACRIYELHRKSEEGEDDLKSAMQFHDEVMYFFKKNKSR